MNRRNYASYRDNKTKQHLFDPKWLYEQHHILNKTLREIAKEQDVDRSFLTKQYKLHNIPFKRRKHLSVESSQKIDSRDWLYEQTVLKGKTAATIARELGSQPTVILMNLKKFDIPQTNLPGTPSPTFLVMTKRDIEICCHLSDTFCLVQFL